MVVGNIKKRHLNNINEVGCIFVSQRFYNNTTYYWYCSIGHVQYMILGYGCLVRGGGMLLHH